MFHQETSEVHEEYVAGLAGNSAGEFPIGRKPIETCDNISEIDVPVALGHSHPIGLVGERLDDQFLIFLAPLAHIRVRVDDRADIINDVLLLPSFLVKGHSTSRQRFQGSSDVDFRSTRDAYMKMGEGKFDQLLHET